MAEQRTDMAHNEESAMPDGRRESMKREGLIKYTIITLLAGLALVFAPLATSANAEPHGKAKGYKHGRKSSKSGKSNKNIRRQYKNGTETITGKLEEVDWEEETLTLDGETFSVKGAEILNIAGNNLIAIDIYRLLPTMKVILVYYNGKLQRVLLLTDIPYIPKEPPAFEQE